MEFGTENPIIQRLRQYITTTGLSSTQFADRASIPRPTFSQMLNGRNKSINNQVLSKLNDNFPELNILWLLFGQGDMRVNANFKSSEPQNTLFSDEKNTEEAQVQDFTDPKTPLENKQVFPANHAYEGLNNVEAPSAGIWHASVLCSPPEEKESERAKTISIETYQRITSIIVLYSDNRFETFYPAQ